MEFCIADTFTDSLARLTGKEQKAVETTAFDLQMNPANPGMSFHKLDKAKDKNFWSVRVSSDIRLIVHRTAASLLLCYVDHHLRLTAGPSDASWKRIRPPALRNWWRFASGACTRARDHLLVTSGNMPSEFIDDLRIHA